MKGKLSTWKTVLIAVLTAVLAVACGAVIVLNTNWAKADSETEIKIIDDDTYGISMYLEFDSAPTKTGSSPTTYNIAPTGIRVKIEGISSKEYLAYVKMTMPAQGGTFDNYFLKNAYYTAGLSSTAIGKDWVDLNTYKLSSAFDKTFALQFAKAGTHTISYEIMSSNGDTLTTGVYSGYTFKISSLKGELIEISGGEGTLDTSNGKDESNRKTTSMLFQDDYNKGKAYGEYKIAIGFDNAPTVALSDTGAVYDTMPKFLLISIPDGYADYFVYWGIGYNEYQLYRGIIDSVKLTTPNKKTSTLMHDNGDITGVAMGRFIDLTLIKNGGSGVTTLCYTFDDLQQNGEYTLTINKHDEYELQTVGVNTHHDQYYQSYSFKFYVGVSTPVEASYKATSFNINGYTAAVYYGSDKWDDANPSEVYAFDKDGSAWFTEGHCADRLYIGVSVYTFYEAEKTGEDSFTGSNVTFYIKNMTWTDSDGNVYNNSYADGVSSATASATSSSGCVEIDFSKYRNGDFVNKPPASGSTVEITLQYKCSWATDYEPITFSFTYGTILEVEKEQGNSYYVSEASAPSSSLDESGITSLSAKIPGSGKYEEIDLDERYIDVGWDTDGWLIVRAEAENSDPVEVKLWVDHSDDYTYFTYLKLTGEGESGDGYQADYQKVEDPLSSGYYEFSLMTYETPSNCTDGTVKNGEYLNKTPMGVYVTVPGETSAGATHNFTLVLEGASHNQTVNSVIVGETNNTSTRLNLDTKGDDDRFDLASGKYKMTLTDDITLAGVKQTVTVTFTFTYDKTAPSFEYEKSIDVGSTTTVLPNTDVESSGSYTYYTNSNSLTVTDDVALAYLYFDYGGSGKYEKIGLSGKNRETVELSELLAIGEGCYSFYMTDMAGNVSPVHTFVYDTTAPVVTLDESEANLSNGANIKVNVVDSSGTALVYYTQVEGSYIDSPKSGNDVKTGTNDNGEKYTYVELSFDYNVNIGYDLWIVVYDRAGNYASPANASEYVGEAVSTVYLSTTGDYFTLDVGEEYPMTAYVEMTSRNEYKGDYKWTADSDAVEIIGSGKDVVILGASEGDAIITVEVDDGFKASVKAVVTDSSEQGDGDDKKGDDDGDGGDKKDDDDKGDGGGGKYTAPYIQSISVSPTYVELAVGGASRTISVSVQMSDSSDYKGTITWSTENADVVNVTGGGTSVSVTAKKVGTAYLYVEAEGYKACCEARVVGEEDMTIPEQDEDGNFWFPDGWTGGTTIHSHGDSLKNLKWTDYGNCVTLTWDNDIVNVNYNGSFLVPDSSEKGEWSFDVCGEYRFMVYCRSCSEMNELTFTIYHDYSKAVFDVADCTKSGKSYLECARDGCDSTKMEEYISPTNHTYISEITQEVDCEHDGICKMTCSICGYSYTYIYEKAWGHDETKTFVSPTCIENPQTLEERGGYYIIACSRDGCDWCEIEIVEGILPTEHTWNSTVTPATCEEDGSIHKVCEICGAESDEVLPATGHSFVLYSVREESTYDEETGETIVTHYETDQCEFCLLLSAEYKIEESKTVAEQIVEFFESYQTYIWWILLVCVAAWSIFFGVRYAISRDDGETRAVGRQIVNYVLGILIIAAICVAVPYLIYGVAAFVA